MINPINNIVSFNPYGYNTNFRSKTDAPLGLDFQPKLRQPLLTDVFEHTKSGGIISSKKTGENIQKFLPGGEIKQFCPSQREAERNKTIEKEKNHIAKTVTKRTEESKRKLRAAGVKEGDIYKYLTYDGHINSDGQRIINGHK